MWKKAKTKFRCWVAIQNVETSMYLTIEPHNNNRLTLHSEFHPDASVFGVHEKEESNFIGFVSKCTHTWLGQSFFGSVVFSSKRFGKREEWEVCMGSNMFYFSSLPADSSTFHLLRELHSAR